MEKLEISIYCDDREYAKALSRYFAVTESDLSVHLLDCKLEAANRIETGKPVLSDVNLKGKYFWLADDWNEDTACASGIAECGADAACATGIAKCGADTACASGIAECGADTACTSGIAKCGADTACASGIAECDTQLRIKLNKYWPIDRIADEICYMLRIWNQSDRRSGAIAKLNGTGARLIALVGCGGGSGNTVITIAIARALSMRGKKVRCLSMEDIDASAVYTGGCVDAPPRTLSDYIYCVLADRIPGAASPNFGAASPNCGAAIPNYGAASPSFGAESPNIRAESPNIRAAIPNYGAASPNTFDERGFTYADAFQVRYFYIDEGQNPFKSLDMQSAEKVLCHMRYALDCDYILFDIGGSITDAVRCVLTNSSKILLTSSDSPVLRYKAHQLKQIILSGQINGAKTAHIAEICNRCRHRNQNKPEREEVGDGLVFYIEENMESFRHTSGRAGVREKNSVHTANHTDILSNSSFQTSIQKIAQWI